MAIAEIPFPFSSIPGQKPGEGGGRLVNTFAERDAGSTSWRPVPGSILFTSIFTEYDEDPPESVDFNGMIVSDDQLYVVYDDKVRKITSNALVTVLDGDSTGAGPVTIAQNNKVPDRDIVMVAGNAAWSISGTDGVDAMDDGGGLPAPNSVCNLDGFFLFTIGDGRIFNSELNSTTVDELNFVTAESSPDGLLRGTVHGGQFFAWGTTTIEVFQNVGTTPSPLQRVTVIPVGLAGPFAVAGSEQGWSEDQVFVAADNTVRRLRGYDPQVVSTKDVERAIAGVTDKTTLRAIVYVNDGHPIWSLSCPTFTWEYNLSTGFWHERKSAASNRWFGECSVYFNNRWVIGRKDTTRLLYIDSSKFQDDGTEIAMRLESGAIKNFPSRAHVSAVFFDFTTGTALITGTDDGINPKVSVQWSMDGGGIWSNEIDSRSLGIQGDRSERIRVNRLGISTHHGVRFRVMTTSPVYRTFRGGKCEYQARGPA